MKKKLIFSSPEQRAQLSVSEENLSVVSVVVIVAGLVVKVSQFHLLQNHWANFNQTWHYASFGEGDLNLFN